MVWVKGKSGNPNGRPKKKTFRDYFNETDEEQLIKHIKEVYKEKPEIVKLVVEHIFGKATQPIDAEVNANVNIYAFGEYKDNLSSEDLDKTAPRGEGEMEGNSLPPESGENNS